MRHLAKRIALFPLYSLFVFCCELYLVYVRDGKIPRINRQPMDTQVLNGYEEAAFIRGYQQ
jgi:hypothetical protein